MHPLRSKKGRTINHEAPAWEPLIALAPEHVDDFMWTHEVELEDGIRLHAYRHWKTRRYLHLDHRGRAFVYVWGEAHSEGEYREVDARRLLELVLGSADQLAMLLRQYVAAEFKSVGWARSATKHRISRKRIRHALGSCVAAFKEDPPSGPPWALDVRLLIFGEDAQGTPLEVIAVIAKDTSLVVIHAMKLRSRYRSLYEEVGRWRK